MYSCLSIYFFYSLEEMKMKVDQSVSDEIIGHGPAGTLVGVGVELKKERVYFV